MSDISLSYKLLSATARVRELEDQRLKLTDRLDRLEDVISTVNESIRTMIKSFFKSAYGLELLQYISASPELHPFLDDILCSDYKFEYTIEHARIDNLRIETSEPHRVGVECKVMRAISIHDLYYTYSLIYIPVSLAVELRQRWLAENEAVE